MSAGDDSEGEYINVDEVNAEEDLPTTPSKLSDVFIASLSKKLVSMQSNDSPPMLQRRSASSPNPTETLPPSSIAPAIAKKPVTNSTGSVYKKSLPLPPVTSKRPLSPRGQGVLSEKVKSRKDSRDCSVGMDSSLNISSFNTTSPNGGGPCVNVEDGETLMLPDLVRKYSKFLPLRVRVEEGFCGSEERFVISSGDIYNFHFMRSEKVASIQDCGNRHFSIPFNSDIQFGVLFDPSDNFKEALGGHTFTSVSELVALKTVPKIVRVINSVESGDKKSLVEPNELLIVKKVGKTMLRKPFMKVYSHTNKEEKTLLDDCDISFTTEPKQVQLYLPELLEQFVHTFPLEAMMFTPGEDIEDLPEHLTTDKVIITHTSIESAIIATTCWDLEDTDMELNTDSKQTTPISIPIDMEVELTILNVDDEDLYQNTKSFISNFDLSKVEDMKMGQVSAENMAEVKKCQTKLSRRIREGYEFRGVNITMSDKLYNGQDIPFRTVLNLPLPPVPYENVTLKPSHQPVKKHLDSPKATQGTKEILPPVSPHMTRPPTVPVRGQSLDGNQIGKKIKLNVAKHRSESGDIQDSTLDSSKPHQSVSKLGRDGGKLPQHGELQDDEVTQLSLRVKALKTLTESAQKNYRKQLSVMRAEMKHLTGIVEGLRAEWKTMRMELDDAKGTPSGAMEIPPPLPAAQTTLSLSPVQEEDNRKALRALSTKEIVNLLDVMKLSQYKEGFAEECIDGEVLAECDENILEKELGVRSKLHLTKFMKLVTGRHSIHYYFTDDYDPYGRFLS